MALVSISEAARLTGKARSTLHKYIKQGKLSTTTDQNTGSRSIETSELIGVSLDIENYCTVSLFFEQAYLSIIFDIQISSLE